jgi:hypothetical protein
MQSDSTLSFLSSLPAILGIVGFVIYQILKRSAAEEPVIKAILDKLSYQEPQILDSLKHLNAAQKEKLLKSDYALREKLSEKDREILDKALSQQFKLNLFVYTLCGGLLIAGIVLYLKPKPLQIDSINIQDTSTNSPDFLVDIDPITITWTSSGEDGQIYVVLENAQTGQQSKRIRALASDGKVKIDPDPYWNFDKVLSNRTPNENNRIRAIVYTDRRSFPSKYFEIKVGVKIICFPQQPNLLTFNAIVDNRIVDNFHFAPRLALFTDDKFNGRKLFEAKEFGPNPSIEIDTPSKYSPVDMAFAVNPSDIIQEGIYRTDVESLKTAILSLKTGKDAAIFPADNQAQQSK